MLALNLIIRVLLTIFYWGTITPWAYQFFDIKKLSWNNLDIFKVWNEHVDFCFFILIGYFVFITITQCIIKHVKHCCRAGKDQLEEVMVHHSTEAIQTILQKVAPARPAPPAPARPAPPAPPLSASLLNVVQPRAGSQRFRKPALRKSVSLNQLLDAMKQEPLDSRHLALLAQLQVAINSNTKMSQPFQPAPNRQKKNPAFEKRRSFSLNHLPVGKANKSHFFLPKDLQTQGGAV